LWFWLLRSAEVALLSNQKWVQVYFTQKNSFWETTTLNCKRKGGGTLGISEKGLLTIEFHRSKLTQIIFENCDWLLQVLTVFYIKFILVLWKFINYFP